MSVFPIKTSQDHRPWNVRLVFRTGGVYYALDFSAFTSEQGMTIATGETIRVEGRITPIAQIPEDDRLHIYAIEGVMRVAGMTRI